MVGKGKSALKVAVERQWKHGAHRGINEILKTKSYFS